MKKKTEDLLYDVSDAWYPEYHVKVVGTGERTGKLTVSFKGKAFYAEPVILSYGAIFGPDVMDIDFWSTTACYVVDKHLRKRGITPYPPEK